MSLLWKKDKGGGMMERLTEWKDDKKNGKGIQYNENGNKYYEVNIYGADISMPSEEKCLCKECTKEISRYFINKDYHEMDISKKY